MFTMDIPSVPTQNTPIVLVQAEAAASAPPVDSTQQADDLLKLCEEKSSAEESNVPNLVDPASWLVLQIGKREHRYINLSTAITKVTLLETTKQGNLIQKTTKDGKGYFIYEPVRDYEGKDKAIFSVEYAGKRYKVVFNLLVSRSVDTNSPLCPEPQFIKVTKPSSGFSGFDLNSISVNIGDLPSGAVGQTTGTTITLDDNAAGYGWFMGIRVRLELFANYTIETKEFLSIILTRRT